MQQTPHTHTHTTDHFFKKKKEKNVKYKTQKIFSLTNDTHTRTRTLQEKKSNEHTREYYCSYSKKKEERIKIQTDFG